MGVQESVKELVRKRCRRTVAIILSVAEEQMDQDSNQFQVLRKTILDQVNEFQDLCLDIMDSLDNDTVILNEEYIIRLDALYELVSDLRE